MNDTTALFPTAVRRIRADVLLPLVAGNLLVLIVAALALLIPDSHVWQLIVSALVALGLGTALLTWNSAALRRVRDRADTTSQLPPLWISALLFAGWLLFTALLFHMLSLAFPQVEVRAGFWNSRLSPGLRHVLTFHRLIVLQRFAIQALQWVVLPALIVPFAMETVTYGLHSRPLSRAVRVLLSARHWLVAIVSLGLAAWLSPVLMDWHPTDTVQGEIVSAALRLLVSALLCLAAFLALLAVDAELLHREAVRYQSVSHT